MITAVLSAQADQKGGGTEGSLRILSHTETVILIEWKATSWEVAESLLDGDRYRTIAPKGAIEFNMDPGSPSIPAATGPILGACMTCTETLPSGPARLTDHTPTMQKTAETISANPA